MNVKYLEASATNGMKNTFHQISRPGTLAVCIFLLLLGGTLEGNAQEIKIKLKVYNQLREEADILNKFLANFGLKGNQATITDKVAKLVELKNVLNSIDNLNKRIKDLEFRKSHLELIKKERTLLEQQLASKDNQLKSRNTQIRQLKQDKQTLTKQVTKLKQENNLVITLKKRLKIDSVTLRKTKGELKTKDVSLKVYKNNNNILNGRVKNQKTEIDRLRKIETKYKAIEKDLKITFIEPVQRFTKSLNYDQAKAWRLQERSQRLAQVIPKHNVALTTLVKNLGVFRRLSIKIKAYKSILNKPYNKNAQTPGNTATLSLAQTNDLATYRKAYNEYCNQTGRTFIRVKSAQAYMNKYPQKMQAKLHQVLAALDKRYGYLRREINKNLQNPQYVCKISRSKCN